MLGDFCGESRLPDCRKRSELTIGLARLLTDDRSMRASDSVTVWAMTSSPVTPVKTKGFDDSRSRLRQRFRQSGLKTFDRRTPSRLGGSPQFPEGIRSISCPRCGSI